MVRTAAGSLAAIVVLFGFVSLIWCYAGAASANADLKEVADLFAWLSPSDPQTHYAAAALHERSLEVGDFDIALREYEIAAALAPNNYLLWLSLGSAKGRAGDLSGAEAAFRRAYELAPHYARTNWALGNFLFRQGQDAEAFPLLRNAVAADVSYASPAATIALLVADNDPNIVRQQFQNHERVDIALAQILAEQKRIDQAMQIWSGIEPKADDKQYEEVETRLRQIMLENKRFEYAVRLLRGKGDNGSQPEIGKITNPGFELPVVTENENPFDWKISRSAYPQVAITNGQKQSGNYSLIVVMNGNDYRDFRGFSQLVAVRPSANYELRVSYRSEVASKAQFMWIVLNALDGKPLATSPPLLPSQVWTTNSVDFSVPAGVEGVELRFVRGDCIASACSAAGSIWFDDLSLTAK